jgi:3-oxoacyl-[acyl-carrier protein] reductase
MTDLAGKTALVTGASRGIGRATALGLANAGAQVLVHYSSGKAEAAAVVAQIHQAGGRAESVAANLRSPDGPHALAKRVRAIVGDRLDILVANAGISKKALIEELTVDDFDNLFAVNVRAPYFLVQQLLPILQKNSSVVLVLVSCACRCRRWQPVSLCGHERCSRYARQAFRVGLGQPGYSCQCYRTRRRPNRYV